MTAFATRIQTGTAACVIAAAAVLTPTAVAHAGPAAQLPVAGIGAGLCDPETSPNCDVTSRRSPFLLALAQSPRDNHPILQNPLWWFGTPNPTPPTADNCLHVLPASPASGFHSAFLRLVQRHQLRSLRRRPHFARRALRHRHGFIQQRLRLISSDATRQLMRRPEPLLPWLHPRSGDPSRARETP